MKQRRGKKHSTGNFKTKSSVSYPLPIILQPSAFKIHPSDFRLQPSLFYPFFRVGIGNDVHRLVRGRKLILGGVRIPFEKGPLGHSDGDALAHAICDALLGAAALGDIGRHFPDTSRRWRNASSLLFLREVKKIIAKAGYGIVNVDATVELERPKLRPFISRIERKLAVALGIKPGQVSVKAKTGEGVDAVGLGLAVRSEAVVLLCMQQRSSEP
ncbi:MAG: 2-C-methyl-D-erythritol 2,4-cyclodiphosphate synthase [Acidobacteria bacterium]|nr:MAG: 2-C-methyl-D-erythritol 2,4-cyclodiphosphate synthase [Acidobacteriota bacterium]